MLDTIRYWLAYLTLGSMPAAVTYWYFIHGFTGFWRRLGKPVTFTAMGLLMVGNLAVVWLARDSLLAADLDLGVHRWMWLPAALFYGTAITIERACRRQLKFHILAGSPELSPEDGDRGQVLSEGIYARIRHPRYVSVVLGTVAAAFFVNYVSVWALTVLMIPGLFLVVLLEERELIDRFGAEYERYAAEVPRFVPRPGS